MSSSSFETLLKDLKALFQFARRPIVWIPGFLVPLTVTALWAYLSHPEWLEATTDRSARTGKAVQVDPNSPVTSADLDLDRLSAVAETGDLSALVNGTLPIPPDRPVQSQDEGDRPKEAEKVSQKTTSGSSTSAKGENPFTPAVLELQERLSNKGTASSAAESPLQQAINQLNGAGAISTQTPVQAPNNASPRSLVSPSANASGQSALSNSRSVPYAYPIQPGIGGYTLPSLGTSQTGTTSNPSVTRQGTTGSSVILPRGTSVEQRGNSRWGQTPYGLTPIRPRGGNIEITDSPVNCTYLRSRGSTGCTTTNNLNSPNSPTQPSQPFNNQTFLNNNNAINPGLNNQTLNNPAFPNNSRNP